MFSTLLGSRNRVYHRLQVAAPGQEEASTARGCGGRCWEEGTQG